jgi:hypothetical protein
MSTFKKLKIFEQNQINENDIIKKRFGLVYETINTDTKKPEFITDLESNIVLKTSNSYNESNIKTVKEPSTKQQQSDFDSKEEIFEIKINKKEFPTRVELDSFVSSINSSGKTVHDCEIKIPYTKEDLKIVENLGSVYQADYNLEYNFLIQKYEEALKNNIVSEACLPNLYMFMYNSLEDERLVLDKKFINFVSLNGTIPEQLIKNKNKISSDNQNEKGEFFDNFAFYLPNAVSSGVLNDLNRAASNIIIPNEEYNNVLNFNKYKELFPMYCDFSFSMDKFSQFSELLKESNLTLSLIYYLVSNELNSTAFVASTDKIVKDTITDQVSNLVTTSNKQIELLNLYNWWNNERLSNTPKPTNSIVLGIGNNTTANNDNKNRFFKNLTYLIFQGKLRKLINQELRTYKEILNGDKCYTETVLYKVLKYENNSNTPIQSYWIPNDPSLDNFNFVDTQLKYGVTYRYEIHAYNLIIGTSYSLNVQNVSETSIDYVFRILADTAPSIQLAKAKIFEVTKTLSDNLPVAPEVNFFPFRAVNNKFKILLNNAVGRFYSRPISILDTDQLYYNRVYSKYGLSDGDEVLFQSDDVPKQFQIFRTLIKPKTYDNFSKDLYQTIDTNGTAVSVLEKIKPNTKYYYLFRSVDYHDNISNPSPVYEIEIVDDDGAIYPVINIVTLNNNENVTNYKSMKKLLQLRPSAAQLFINEQKSKLLENNSAYDINKNSLFLGREKESVWGKDFKIRLTSKQTGKKIDINFTLTTELIKEK